MVQITQDGENEQNVAFMFRTAGALASSHGSLILKATATAVSRKRKVKKLIRRCEIKNVAEG